MLQRVEYLRSKGVFDVVASEFFIEKVEPRPLDPMIDQRKMVDRVWDILMEDRVDMLWLHGVPGVGKTTLLSHINNEFLRRENGFDIVIWVGLGQDQDISRIQKDIAIRLELYDQVWEKKTEHDKTFDIRRALNKMKYALLVDDMVLTMDLRKIGFVLPDAIKGSKVIFTIV